MSGVKTKLRLADDDFDGENGGIKGALERGAALGQAAAKKALSAAAWIYSKGGRMTWVVLTTAIVAALPLILEVEREQVVIEMERLQVRELQAQGYNDHQIANMGLSAGLEVEPTLPLPGPADAAAGGPVASPPAQ